MTRQEVLDAEIKYRTSFINREDFEGKRFERYVKKVKDFVYKEYLLVAYPMLPDIGGIVVNNLVDAIIAFFNAYYISVGKEEKREGTLLSTLHKYSYANIDVKQNMETIKKYVTNPYSKAFGEIALDKVIDSEIHKVCKEFIRYKSMTMPDIDFSNYMFALPSTPKDAIYIFEHILNYVQIDIENFTCSKMGQSILSSFNEKWHKEAMEAQESQLKCISELNAELSDKNSKINSLETRLSSIEGSHRATLDEMDAHIATLERQIVKLKNKYNNLLSKYENLKSQVDIEDDVEEDVEDSFIQEIDVDGRYLFVSTRDAAFEQVVLDTFKNATFCDSNVNIQPTSVDLVVVLTSSIGHSVYYGVKEQCKNKGIPFIHCKFSNIDLIKETIANVVIA